jgi:hypothetical protein
MPKSLQKGVPKILAVAHEILANSGSIGDLHQRRPMRAILLAAVVFSLTAPGISRVGRVHERDHTADPVPAQARSGAQTGTKNTLGVFHKPGAKSHIP